MISCEYSYSTRLHQILCTGHWGVIPHFTPSPSCGNRSEVTPHDVWYREVCPWTGFKTKPQSHRRTRLKLTAFCCNYSEGIRSSLHFQISPTRAVEEIWTELLSLTTLLADRPPCTFVAVGGECVPYNLTFFFQWITFDFISFCVNKLPTQDLFLREFEFHLFKHSLWSLEFRIPTRLSRIWYFRPK